MADSYYIFFRSHRLQCTDSTYVLGAIHAINRVELAEETMNDAVSVKCDCCSCIRLDVIAQSTGLLRKNCFPRFVGFLR